MMALVFRGPENMEWTSVPDPVMTRGADVLMEVVVVGICGSDVHGYTGQSGRRRPGMIMGHEAVGVVRDTHGHGSLVGRRVVLYPIVSCGACDQCVSGFANRCRARGFFGGTMDGAMAQLLAVPRANVVETDDTVCVASDPSVLVLAEPLAVAVHAVRIAGDIQDKSVFVCGGGPVGLLVSWCAKRRGARRVTVSDLIPARREMALALGADEVLSGTAKAGFVGEAVSVGRIAEDEFDVTFEAVGVAAALSNAVAAAAPGGTVVLLGGWRKAELSLPHAVAKELTLRGTFNYSRDELEESVQIVSENRSILDQLITDIERMDAGPSVFARLARDPGRSSKTVLRVE